MSESLLVHGSRNELAAALAGQLEQAITDGLAQRQTAVLVVAGGSTPAPAYRALDQRPLDFSRVAMVPSDERWVPADHELSNDAMLRGAFPGALANGLNIVALADATREIDAALPAVTARVAELPRPFDLVLLGMGEDGHTASVFPDDPGVADLEASTELVGVARPPSQPTARVTLTPAALLQARAIVLAISGISKRRVLEHALAEPAALPIGRLLQRATAPIMIHWCP